MSVSMSYGRGDLTSDGFNSSASYNTGSYQNSGGTQDYTRLTQLIGTNIQKIAQNVQEFKRMVNQLGTNQDTPDLRNRLHQRQHHTNQISKDTARYLKDVKGLPSTQAAAEQRRRKTQTERLMADFSDVLNSFQAAQREAATTEKECVARVRASSTAHQEPGSDVLINIQGTMQDQQQATVSAEELQDIEERETAIRQLEADIMDVNMIFKDLGTMVHEQGEMIDSIEANVEHAEQDVVQGNVQLVQARASQSSARKKKLICFILLIVAIVVIALIIYFSVKK
uniref:syntaxin-7 n=1 Tax=Ciona intestinalis TaxID=7719 RepID=UPI00006A41D9|nr:syntaxin-7 [Ciona intestinalis]|eukprot:XP_002123047.1 syntaxin-7 [Ciona intestinalis]